MMRKRFLSLTCALVLCLSLLPVTALADAPNGQVIYVGNENVTSGGYWTTDSAGNVTQYNEEGKPSNNYIHYNTATNTLTLHNATIKESVSTDTSTYVAGAAIGVHNQNGVAELTITLEGTNTIEDVSAAIHVFASSTSTGAANLTITGNGSLNASGSYNPGIRVQSNTGNGTLAITGAKVTASSSSGGNGVQIRVGNGSNASLTVNGGSLTATGSGVSRGGIEFQFGSSESGPGTPSLNVSGSAIVKASGDTEGITSNSSPVTPSGTGIVFNNGTGTVYGNVTLQEDLTIGEGERLNIPSGASLTIDSGATLTNEGTVTNSGTLTNNGKIENSGTLPDDIDGTAPPRITTTALDDGTVNTSYSETLNADGSPTSWEVTDGSLPAGLTLDESTGLISGTPTTAGTSTFTVKAANDYGSDSKELSITIDAQTNVPVTGVTLSQTELSLTEGNTAQLTATVKPDNATNKNVTWSSSAPNVATVDSSGKVTAVAPGTATITVTTQDGNHTATCTVTVRPDIPPANPNYRITVEATQGGTVTADPTAAKAGTTVTLTPVPDRGYQVGTVTVTDRFGDTVEVTENADGTYTFTMPNGQVRVNVTFVEVQPEPLPFTDVAETDWFHDAVRYVYDNGLMEGVGDGQFAPNATTNRAMVVTILYRLAGEPDVSGDVAFTDVAPGLWYTDAVAWAAQKGIVNGISETEFSPSGDLTREQLATILFRYAEAKGYDVSAAADLSGFPDAGDIQDYAMEALSWAVAEGLLQGFEDDSLQPQATATRAQIAAVLMRFLAAVPTE